MCDQALGILAADVVEREAIDLVSVGQAQLERRPPRYIEGAPLWVFEPEFDGYSLNVTRRLTSPDMNSTLVMMADNVELRAKFHCVYGLIPSYCAGRAAAT
jgi:hypothetical protein